MNELIKELAEKAGLPFHHGFMWSELDSDEKTNFLEKFAELIVRECANQLDDGAEDGMWARSVLYKNFGVEE